MTQQGVLFDDPAILLRCAFGQTGEGWIGRHHCAACAAEVERQCQEFAAEVAAGEYDADGTKRRKK